MGGGIKVYAGENGMLKKKNCHSDSGKVVQVSD